MFKDKVTDQFSDDEMNQIKHYGQMLGGGVTPYDEAVEEALNKRQAAREANAKNMRVAQTGGGDIGLGPSQIDQHAIKQRGDIASQAATGGSQEAQAAQARQPSLEPPPVPAGPERGPRPLTRLRKAHRVRHRAHPRQLLEVMEAARKKSLRRC